MTQGEYTRLVAQIAVLKEIAEEYSGKTIDNIIVQMEARRKDVENHTYRRNPKTGKDAYIVLTIAHLDHTPENCSDDNLKALCQRCHNRYDAEHRKQTRKGNSADGTPFGRTEE